MIIITAGLILAWILFYRLYFLRNPKRDVPKSNSVISPANGKVVKIIEVKNNKPLNIKKGLIGKVNLLTGDTIRSGYVVVIMMTPLNVHFQRSPVSGKVISTRYIEGKFNNAVKNACALNCLENEKNEIIIENKTIGKIKVVQVAGFLARRIRCFVSNMQKIHKGDDIGLICLGSQVILVVPKLKLQVSEGDIVIDGETVIAGY